MNFEDEIRLNNYLKREGSFHDCEEAGCDVPPDSDRLINLGGVKWVRIPRPLWVVEMIRGRKNRL